MINVVLVIVTDYNGNGIKITYQEFPYLEEIKNTKCRYAFESSSIY